MEILGWPSTSMWGAVPVCLEACGLLGEYGDTLKTPARLMRLFKELCIAHRGKKESARLQLWAGLSYGHFGWPRAPS